jgi:polar amino acid transport system substrate-binding protein
VAALLLVRGVPWPGREAHAEPLPIRVVLADLGETDGSNDLGRLTHSALARTLALVEREAGIRFSFDRYPWRRAQAMVEEGGADAFCTTRTPDRERYAIFAATPVLRSGMALYFRADDPRPRAVHSLGDLAALRQGDYFGNGWAESIFPKDRIVWARGLVEVVNMLEAGRIDVTVEDEALGPILLKRLGLEGRIASVPAPFLPAGDFQFGLRRSFPDAATVLDRIELAITAAQARPDYAMAAEPFRW